MDGQHHHHGKVRLGIIGTGIFAVKAHLPAIQQWPDLFEIVACANRTEDKVLQYAELVGLAKDHVYTDYNKLLDRSDVDAVVVALPVEFNYEVSKAALAKGKHVIMEKPIAHNLEDGQKIVELAKEYPKQVFMIAENYAYKESISAAAEIISSGLLGDVVTFSLVVVRQFDAVNNPYLATSWRQKPSHVGGYLSDGGVHWSALLVATLGPVASVGAFARQIEAINGADDTIALSLRLKSGVVGSWTMTYSAGAPGFANFTVVGRKGTLVFTDLNTLTVTNDKGEVVKQATFVEDSAPTTTAKKDIVDEFKDFHATIQRRHNQEHHAEEHAEDFVLVHKTQPKVTLEETFHHLAIIASALKSVETKQLTDVPLLH